MMSLARPCKRLRLLAPQSQSSPVALPYRPSPVAHLPHRHYARATAISSRRGERARSNTWKPTPLLSVIMNRPKPTITVAVKDTPIQEEPETLVVDNQEIDPKENPVLADYLKSKSKPKGPRLSAQAAAKKTLKSRIGTAVPGSGALAPSSIFDIELQDSKETRSRPETTKPAKSSEKAASNAPQHAKTARTRRPEPVPADEADEDHHERDPVAMLARLDPKPSPRRYWMRKMVIRDIVNRGRLTREQLLLRTERFNLSKSPFYRTSVKKLGMLARQIQGKPLEEALTQMRYSRKRVAQEVRKHLQASRDDATIRKGMGLGGATTEKGQPRTILLKNGERHFVDDQSKMYIDQAWVGRGPYGRDVDYRARGRSNILRLPQTSLTVVLKEEATRVREHEERVEKSKNRKLWVPLPDRPIHTQRQYFCW